MMRFAAVATVLLVCGLVVAKFDPSTGFTSLIRFGEPWRERRLPELAALGVATEPRSSGYDGQFYAQLAVDPTLRNPDLERALDAPAYRARRILTPAITHVLGLGHPRTVLEIYALVNVAAWFGLAWLLYREIQPSTALAFARWAGCVLSLGVLESVRQALVDLPALLLMCLAVVRYRANAGGGTGAGIVAAAGHLAKETNLLASLALAAHRPLAGRKLAWLLVTTLPVALWAGYVAHRFNAPLTTQSGIGNFTAPFVGLTEQLLVSAAAIGSGNWDSRHVFALVGIAGLIVQLYVIVRHRDSANPWWRIGAAYGVLLLFLGTWVWSGYWAVFRAVLPLTIAFNLLLPADRSFWPLWAIGNLTILHGIWRFL